MDFFNMKELSHLYRRLREWPVEYRAWPHFYYQPRKNTIEVTIFFMFDGDAMRSDQEVILDDWPEPQSWTEEEIDRLADQVWEDFKDNLEEWVKDNEPEG
jgi:hypothetical protein